MSASVFDHPWLSGLFADVEVGALWSPEAQLTHMVAFEAAWSRALGAAGLVEPEVAEAAARAIETAEIDIEGLAAGCAKDGLPVPALVHQLKALAGGAGVHSGSTSQDVLDTALALTMRDSVTLLIERLEVLEAGLRSLEDRFGDAPLMGRTRMQAATQITVRDRVLTWKMPLEAHRSDLTALRPRLSEAQIGGASGDRAALGDKAEEVARRVADALGLGVGDKAWHAMRERVGAFASALSLITGTLGKMGQDMALMAQQGIDEIALSGGGGSSAMPHKQNPILAELLVTLARYNATQLAGIHQALVHEQERSGAAWALEWMILPGMAQATGRALTAGLDLVDRVERMGTPD